MTCVKSISFKAVRKVLDSETWPLAIQSVGAYGFTTGRNYLLRKLHEAANEEAAKA